MKWKWPTSCSSVAKRKQPQRVCRKGWPYLHVCRFASPGLLQSGCTSAGGREGETRNKSDGKESAAHNHTMHKSISPLLQLLMCVLAWLPGGALELRCQWNPTIWRHENTKSVNARVGRGRLETPRRNFPLALSVQTCTYSSVELGSWDGEKPWQQKGMRSHGTSMCGGVQVKKEPQIHKEKPRRRCKRTE